MAPSKLHYADSRVRHRRLLRHPHRLRHHSPASDARHAPPRVDVVAAVKSDANADSIPAAPTPAAAPTSPYSDSSMHSAPAPTPCSGRCGPELDRRRSLDSSAVVSLVSARRVKLQNLEGPVWRFPNPFGQRLSRRCRGSLIGADRRARTV